MIGSSAPRSTEAVVLQKDARVGADRNLAVTEFALGAIVAVALVFAAVLSAHRRLGLRLREW